MIVLTTIWGWVKTFFGWFFKQDLKSIIIELLVVAVIVLFLIIKFRKEASTQIVYLPDTQQLDSLESYKDKNGKLTETLQQVALQNTQLQAAVDSLSKAINIKSNQVTQVTQIKTNTIVKDSNIVVTVDKHENKTFATSTPYIDLDVEIDSANKGSFYLSTIDTLTVVETVKKPFLNLFGPTVHNLYFRNQNPYNHITEGNSYIVKEKTLWLTIGPSIEYNPFTKKIDFGISVQYPLIKLKH